MNEAIEQKVARLPRKPGVYLWKGADGSILYVGKAADLRTRARSYVQAAAALPAKTRVLMEHAADLDYIVTDSEVEALLLESNLIKEHDPRFNILLRDDKTYPYIKVTLQEEFPRVYVTRRVVEDGARYFGPYTQVKLLRGNLSLIKDLFPVRSCRYDLLEEAPSRPCLDYHIDRCDAPCVGHVSRDEYRAMIDDVVGFLEGDTRAVRRSLEARMEGAVERLQFERAEQYRRQIEGLEEIREGQRMTSVSGDDRDVVALARAGDEAVGLILKIRGGRLLGKEHHVLGNVGDADDGEALSLFLTRYWLQRADRFPPEVLVPFDFEDRTLFEQAAARRSDRAVRFHVPRRGDKARQIRLAERNARLLLEERRLKEAEATRRATDAVLELQAELGLRRIPYRIACVDISTIQGAESVGSVVTFANGEPRKAGYRRFRIKYVEGQDDFAMMAEVVARYVRNLLDHDEDLPDLLVIDGGKGQLSSAMAVLEELGAVGDLDVLGLAKRDEEIFLPGRGEPVWLPRNSDALRLAQRIRDEAHRFAITYHRKLRGRRTIGSELDEVPGIGPRRRAALLHHFRSVERIRRTTADEIARVPGFSTGLAERVKSALGEAGPPAG